ncbi:RING-type domain-containing protein [Plasmodiophora brassicae]
MTAMLRYGFEDRQVLRVDGAADIILETDAAIRASQVTSIMRQTSARDVEASRVPVAQLVARVDLVAFDKPSPGELRVTAVATEPFTVVVHAMGAEQVRSLFDGRDAAGAVQARAKRGTQHRFPAMPTGGHVVLDAPGHAPSESLVVIVGDGPAYHVVVLDEGAGSDAPGAVVVVREHVFVSGRQVVHVKDVFGADENLECAVCLSNRRGVILLPCMHACVCDECNAMLDRCPVCRAHITCYLAAADDPHGVPGRPPIDADGNHLL